MLPDTRQTPAIQINGVTRRFGGFAALEDVTFDVPGGELVALLGPSGSGKTTLLRVIAGLERPDAGAILFGGEDATARRPRDRGIGFVFQHYALFRHMTVFENVAFGLRVLPRRARPNEAEIRRRVLELLDLVQLGPLGKRYPSQLSGGQRQRVGLARALATKPRVLLLDEPFGALDAGVRKELRRWLRRLHDEIRITSVFVTHDQDEALEVADRIVVMHNGRVEQIGTPEEVYDRPATPFVYGFLGSVNLFHARLDSGELHIGSPSQAVPEGAGAEEGAAVAFVRTHEVEICTAPNGNTFEAVVNHSRMLGASVRLELSGVVDGGTIEAELSRERYAELQLQRGDRVFVRPRRARVFVPEQEVSTLQPDLEWVL
ncbi:MAG TPA: sulfate ABC transporter ATP-binding protein [Gemmatimonadales bacterium]|nr:sulfate ABC transporter ATP-binding protein [Gemmatimonadales bacterium]